MPESTNLETFRQWLFIASTIFFAELADKTQLTAFAFASSSKLTSFQVWLACCAGLAVASGLAIAAASWLAPLVAQYNVPRFAGLLFIVIGLWMVFSKSH